MLAEALQALFDWASDPSTANGDFKVILYALETARYQYGGKSAYLGESSVK